MERQEEGALRLRSRGGACWKGAEPDGRGGACGPRGLGSDPLAAETATPKVVFAPAFTPISGFRSPRQPFCTP